MLDKLDLFLEVVEKDNFNSAVFRELLAKNFFDRKEIIEKISTLALANINNKKWNKYLSYIVVCANLYYREYKEMFHEFIKKCGVKKGEVLLNFFEVTPFFEFEEFMEDIKNLPIAKKLLLIKILGKNADFNNSSTLLIDTLIKEILENKENNCYYPCLLILEYMNHNNQFLEDFLNRYQINLTDFFPDILKHFYPDVVFDHLKKKIIYQKDEKIPLRDINTITKYLENLIYFCNNSDILSTISKILKEETLRNDKFRDIGSSYSRRDEVYALKLASFTKLLLSKIPYLDLKVFRNIDVNLEEDFINALLTCYQNSSSTLPYQIAYRNQFACSTNFNDQVINRNLLLPYVVDDFLRMGLIKFFKSEPIVKWPLLKGKFYEALQTNYINKGDDLALRVYYEFLTTNMSPLVAEELDLEYLNALKEHENKESFETEKVKKLEK